MCEKEVAYFSITTLVDEIMNRFQRRCSKSDIGNDHLEHLLGGLVDLQEHTVVDLRIVGGSKQILEEDETVQGSSWALEERH